MGSRTNSNIFAAILVVTLAMVGAMSVSTSAEIDHDTFEFKLTKLFDFESYKKSFDKIYNSEGEESMRRCLFYARALAAFVSGVNYKYRTSDHYLALNDMSDWTPEERYMAENKRLHRMVTRSMSKHMEKLAFMPVKDERPEETLRKFLEERADDPIYKDLLNELLEKTDSETVVKQRRKRETESESELSPRDFSFDKLIHEKGAEKHPARKRKQAKNVNKDYVQAEPVVRDYSDEMREVHVEVYEDKDAPVVIKRLESSSGSLKHASSNTKKGEIDSDSENVMFVDHSKAGCMNEIRNQGKCGSCYAFSATAIAEWLYCRRSGILEEFSEQYIVDCAKEYGIKYMGGCHGGTEFGSLTFMETLGMELRRNIEYQAKETVCPHEKGVTDPDTAGYIRMDLGEAAEIPFIMIDAFLKHMPLSVVIKTYDGFGDYGGGVDDGSACKRSLIEEPDRYHAVVMVGSGREDGQDYWLIRNSHGTDWGDNGYYKLSKNIDKECFMAANAYAFGTKDGLNYNARPRKNRRYKPVTRKDGQDQKKIQILQHELGSK